MCGMPELHDLQNESGTPMVSTSSTSPRPRLVVVAPDIVGTKMAGPGIRFVAIARQMSDVADVTLALGPEGSRIEEVADLGFAVAEYSDRASLVAIVAAHDIAFCQLIDQEVVRQGMDAGCRFIFDLYNALPAEAIGAERIGGFDTQPEMDNAFTDVLAFFRFCLRAGSYFVTSNERQRDFWIGYMMAVDALLPSELRGRHASDVVGLVPFGMEDDEPTSRRRAIRDGLGIGDEALVLLWAGGIWDWFDAETPIRAVTSTRTDGADVHLVFYGTTHPNPMIGTPKAVARARALADDLGVLDAGVHFIDGWVPAEERADYLLDADIAISAHKESFETRYAFRTRILDHFWATLPSIVTEGDWFADYIAAEGLGRVTGYGDVDSTVAAIEELATPEARALIRAEVARVRDSWRWESTTAPLREAVSDWQRRLPLRDPLPAPEIAVTPPPISPDAPTWRAELRSALARSPLGPVVRRVRRALGR